MLCLDSLDEIPTPRLWTNVEQDSNILRQHKCQSYIQQPCSSLLKEAHRYQVLFYPRACHEWYCGVTLCTHRATNCRNLH